jgi:NAD-dependent deacetylase
MASARVADSERLSGAGAELERAAKLLSAAGRILILTGAGVSAESGVPTFRGPDGLWGRYRPEDLATPAAFRRDARLVWEWYAWRHSRVSACEPNPAHHAIARLVRGHDGAALTTQNVDGLHERAARAAAPGPELPARELPRELHGSLFRLRCTRCDWRGPLVEPVDATSDETLPRCAGCGALLRPDVVWFGEALDPEVLEGAFRMAEAAELCLVVGTSALVQPAASLPLATLRHGGAVIEVNAERTPLSSACAVSLQGRAGVILPELLAAE